MYIVYCNLFCKLQRKRCLCTSFKLEAKGARGYSVWIKSNPCGGHVKFVLFYHIEISWIYTYIPNIEKKNPRMYLLTYVPFFCRHYYCSNRPYKKKRNSMTLVGL